MAASIIHKYHASNDGDGNGNDDVSGEAALGGETWNMRGTEGTSGGMRDQGGRRKDALGWGVLSDADITC